MVMPRNQQPQGQIQGQNNAERPSNRSLGFFLQCNGESESASWSCNAVADLRLLAVKEGTENFSRSECILIILSRCERMFVIFNRCECM